MKPKQPTAKSPFTPKPGLFATLTGSLRAKGTGAPSPRRRTSLALAPLLALAAITACLVPSSALALKTHVFKAAFGEPGSGDGQLSLQAFSAEPPVAGSGLAVNEATHDVYVADTGNHRVDQFSATGTFIRAFGADVGGAGVNVCTLGCVAGTPGSSPGAFEAPAFIAVDNSAGASKGDVYVGDASTNVVTKFEADGTLVSGWGVGGQLDGKAATTPFAGPFAQVVGIAVDASGNLDVLENAEHALFRFAQDSSFTEDFETPRETAPAGLAVDPGGNFFKVNGSPSVEKFDASGSDVAQITFLAEPPTPGEVSTGLGVHSASGTLYVDHGGASIYEYAFEPSGEVQGSGCTPHPGEGCPPTDIFASKHLTAGGALAVDGASETVYAADPGTGQIVGFVAAVLPEAATEAATEVDHESATLHGTLSAAGGPEVSCQFQYITEASFLANKEGNPSGDGFEGSTSAGCSPPGPFTGSTKEALSAKLSGLASGTSYRFRIVASSENGSVPGEPLSFFTPGPPVISGESVSAISATAAKVNALIDPVGSPTSFVVQYIDAGAYEANPESDRFAGATKVPVPAHEIPTTVTGSGDLTEGETRVSRLAATAGSFAAGQAISGPGIAPGTTIHSVLTAVEVILSKPASATIAAAALTATGPEPVTQQLTGLTPDTTYHYRLLATNQVETVPGEDNSFTTFVLAPPTLPDNRAYEMVTPPQKLGEVFPPEPSSILGGSCNGCLLPGANSPPMPMQSAPDGESVLYVGQPFTGGLASISDEYFSHRGSSGWEAPQSLNSSPLFEFFVDQGFKAFSSDLSRSVLYNVKAALAPEAPTREGKSFANLYLRGEDGSLQPLITHEPPQRAPGEKGGNEFRIVYAGANSGTASSQAFGHVIFAANDALTEDLPGIAPKAPEIEAGQRCITLGENCNLYESSAGQLHLLNVLPGNATALAGAVIGSGRLLALEGASREGTDVDHAISADGRRIFWSDGSSGQVYVRIDGHETQEIADHVGRFLTASADGSKVLLSDGCLYDLQARACEDLTQGQGEFQGILGAAEDLSRVYFVDTAALTGGQENANHEHAEAGKANLYSSHEGATSFIAALANEAEVRSDNTLAVYGDWRASRPNRTAQVSPDGRYLAFMSLAPLTGYDNNLPGSGRCGGSTTTPACTEVFEYDATSAQLTCTSCNPTGQRPLGGPSNLSLIRPEPYFPPFRQPGNLTAEGQGRLFFESQDTLSPHDTNGHIQDVYEWEPNGVGSCKRAAGCVFLISSGNSPVDSMFLDATPSGNDAFFVTREQLSPQDKDELLDLYDARVDGGFSAGGEAAPCGGEACKGALSSAPESQAPGSSIFSGPGNFAFSLTPTPNVKPKQLTRAQKLAKALKACAKKPKRKRKACRVKARKRYGPTKARAKSKSKSHKGGN